MSSHQSPVEAHHGAQPPEHGRHTDQGITAAQARRKYLQQAGGGLVAALLGTVTRPSEIRTRDGAQFLVFGTMADGDRLPDEPPTMARVECFGDVDALAPRLVKSASVYCEGRLTLSTWTGRDGVERSGLNIRATHVEVLERGTMP